MIRGLHAGMLGRSRYLSGLRWDDDGDAMHGMPFFDYALTKGRSAQWNVSQTTNPTTNAVNWKPARDSERYVGARFSISY